MSVKNIVYKILYSSVQIINIKKCNLIILYFIILKNVWL
jgi:hypothetical protein